MTAPSPELAAAKAAGEVHYFTGKPCVRGHRAPRRVSDRACVECSVAKSASPEGRARLARHRRTSSWRARHAAQAGKRRAAQLNRTPQWLSESDLERIRELYEEASLFSVAFGVLMDVDHILPLRGDEVSGLHVPSNLQIIPASTNRAKGNRTNLCALPQ